jgi:hypothetical protein
MQTLTRMASVWLSLIATTIHQTAPIYGQVIPVPAPRMNVVVVDGEAVIHNVHSKKATDIVVLVRDGNRKPMPRVNVTFSLPAEGAGAAFPNNAKTLTARTGDDGYAVARGLRSNNIPGPFRIEVEAEYEGQRATTAVTQFNMSVTSSKGGSGKMLAVLGIVGAAAAGGAVAALRNSGNSRTQPSAPPTPIGISPGPSTVGPPR